MEQGNATEAINPWAVALFRSLKTTEPQSSSEQSAYDKWLDQTFARGRAQRTPPPRRRDHSHASLVGALLSAGLIFGFMLFFADSAERAVVQGVLIGTVTVVIVAMLLLLRALDSPFHGGVGGLEPTAMERTLVVLEEARRIVGDDEPPPCDAAGVATRP